MPTLSERLSIIIDASGVGAISTFKKVGSTAKAELGAVDKATDGTRQRTGLLGKGLDRLGLQSISAGDAMKAGVAAGATIAATALVKFGADGVKAFSAATGEVSKFKRVAGGTAEDASRLVFAMQSLKVDTDAGAKAFGLLSKSIENTPGKLEKIGIAVQHNKQGNVDLEATLFNIADAYNATSDQAEKNNIALTALGRGGLALVPILARGREGLEELFKAAQRSHFIFSDEDLRKGKEFRLATTQLSLAMQGLKVEAGRELVPALTKVAAGLTKLIQYADDGAQKLGNLRGKHVDLTEAALQAVPGVGLLARGLGILGDKTVDEAKAAQEQTEALEEQAKSADMATKASQDLADAQKEAANATFDAIDAALGYRSSLLDLNDDQRAITKAQQEYNEAVAKYGAKSAEAAEAADDLARAQIALQTDVLGAAKAFAEQNGHQADSIMGVRDQIAKLREMRDQYPQLRNEIDLYIAKLLSIPGVVNTTAHITYTAPSGRTKLESDSKNRNTAHGGIFAGAQLRVIGEDGPEAVVPLSSKHAADRQRVMRQAGLSGWAGGGIAGVGTGLGGATFHVTVNANDAVGGSAAGQALVDVLVRWQRDNGPLPFRTAG